MTMTPAETARWRIANASTGVGNGRGSTEAVIPKPRHDRCGVPRKDIRLVPCVVTDDDRRAARVEQVSSEPSGGTDDDRAVHPIRPGAKRAAQPCGTELKARTEAIGQPLVVPRLKQRRQLGARIRVWVFGEPGSRSSLVVHSRDTTCASSAPMRAADAFPAARTSRWSSGSPVMPAARLVTNEMPSTSRAGVTRGDRFECGRHADEVGAEYAQRLDLGRSFVVRARQLGVHTFGEGRVDLARDRAQSCAVEVGQVDEASRPAAATSR